MANVLDKENETFDIPLDIGDILSICKEYANLGRQIQTQIECIIELGIDKAISNGAIKASSLPFIKNFLHKIQENYWFGDASEQANQCLTLIYNYESRYPEQFKEINYNN